MHGLHVPKTPLKRVMSTSTRLKNGASQALNFLLENALAMVQYRVKLNKVDIVKKLEKDLPAPGS